MKNQRRPRSRARRKADALLFPVRALFIPEESRWGMTSLRDERFEEVAAFCRGHVLDIGCGRKNVFIREWIRQDFGIGVDVFPYEGVDNLVEDMTCLPFGDNVFDTVTLIAVGGHIPRHLRQAEFEEFARVLRSGGRLVMTEGEPVSQTLGHLWRHFSLRLIGRSDMDSERGMEHDEEYCMPFDELISYVNTPPFRLVQRRRFMWKLNNVYVAEKR